MRHVLVLWFAAGAGALFGCEDGGAEPGRLGDGPAADRGAPPEAGPMDLALPAGDLGPDEGTPPPLACSFDGDCGERAFCAQGRCTPGRADSVVAALPHDGITRVGAASFELTPEAFETWTDQAGPGCPDNRPGRFDGRLDVPRPADPCADGFEDADGDGRFDAVWLGGEGLDRPARAVDNLNPPAGRALLLARDDTTRVLVTLDVHALDAARVAELERGLRLRLGLAEGVVLIHATGSRSGPDAVGLDGPSVATAPGPAGETLRGLGDGLGLLASVPVRSGLDPAWFAMVVERTAAAVERAVAAAAPARVAAARVRLPLDADPPTDGAFFAPDADGDGRLNDPDDLAAWRARPRRLARDESLPGARDFDLRVVGFRAAVDDRLLAVVLSWGAAPAAEPPAEGRLSADFPGRVRASLEAEGAAVAVWVTGASADTVQAGRAARVPAVDAEGRLVDEAGAPVEDPGAAAPSADPVEGLGVLLARAAGRALAAAEWAPAALRAQGRYVWLPLTNPRLGLAARLGVMGPLGDWLSGRRSTLRWASPETTPACGGLGCARYRLERVDLGPVTWVTLPGALDGGLARGRGPVQISYGEALPLSDLDLDGIPDAEDPEIRVRSAGASPARQVILPGPLNPQRFAAATGLDSERIWLLGRINGGLGSLRDPGSVPPVFEGQLEPLAAAAQGEAGALDLCKLGYPCRGEQTLAGLVALSFAAQPLALADLPGGSELWLRDLVLQGVEQVGRWLIEDPAGGLRASGEVLNLGPGDRGFAPGVDLRAAGVAPADLLRIGDAPALTVGGLSPLVLRDHPNQADVWRSGSPGGGDLVYNTACELVFDGACPHRREPVGPDPNATLRRTP